MFKNHNNKRKIRKIRKLKKQLKIIADINSHLHDYLRGDIRIIDRYSDFLTKPTIKIYRRPDFGEDYVEFDFRLITPKREIAIQKTMRTSMRFEKEYITQQQRQIVEEMRKMFIEHLAKNLTVEVVYVD